MSSVSSDALTSAAQVEFRFFDCLRFTLSSQARARTDPAPGFLSRTSGLRLDLDPYVSKSLPCPPSDTFNYLCHVEDITLETLLGVLKVTKLLNHGPSPFFLSTEVLKLSRKSSRQTLIRELNCL